MIGEGEGDHWLSRIPFRVLRSLFDVQLAELRKLSITEQAAWCRTLRSDGFDYYYHSVEKAKALAVMIRIVGHTSRR